MACKYIAHSAFLRGDELQVFNDPALQKAKASVDKAYAFIPRPQRWIKRQGGGDPIRAQKSLMLLNKGIGRQARQIRRGEMEISCVRDALSICVLFSVTLAIRSAGSHAGRGWAKRSHGRE